MVMQIEPIDRAISALKAERDYDDVIFVSPDGEQFTQHVANDLSMEKNLIILAGHYKGVDQRVRDHLITREISVGDYVLTGGELPAASSPMLSYVSFRVSSATTRAHYPTVSRTICWQHLYIHVLENTRDGKFLIFYSAETRRRYGSGSSIRRWNARASSVPTCLMARRKALRRNKDH